MLRNLKAKIAISGLAFFLAAAFSVALLPWPAEQPRAANVRVTPEQFSKYIGDWSEPDGFFDTDNFISNETSYLHAIDKLRTQVQPGGVYVGVGPDQNFSYIAQTRPSLAIIVDIRRQNMLQLVFYKALFAMASNRAEYLSLLFAKEKGQFRNDASFEDLLKAVRAAPTSDALFRKHLAALQETLLQTFKLKLTADDLSKIEYIYRTFWEESLDLRFSSIGRGNAMQYPRFEELLLATDRQGRQQNYLATEDSFQWLKKFQSENRLIPIVGDFAGPKAFKNVAQFLQQNALRVSTFYASNVEFYLFGRPTWPRYMANLHLLPVDPRSVIIRAYFSNFGQRHPENVPGHRSTTLVHEMKEFIDDYDAGAIDSYWNVVYR